MILWYLVWCWFYVALLSQWQTFHPMIVNLLSIRWLSKCFGWIRSIPSRSSNTSSAKVNKHDLQRVSCDLTGDPKPEITVRKSHFSPLFSQAHRKSEQWQVRSPCLAGEKTTTLEDARCYFGLEFLASFRTSGCSHLSLHVLPAFLLRIFDRHLFGKNSSVRWTTVCFGHDYSMEKNQVTFQSHNPCDTFQVGWPFWAKITVFWKEIRWGWTLPLLPSPVLLIRIDVVCQKLCRS